MSFYVLNEEVVRSHREIK